MATSLRPGITRDGCSFEFADGTLQRGLPTSAARSPSEPLNTNTPFDAIVIGAGYAGLTAARDLSLGGLAVLLIEARDRIGGRTWTADLGDHKYELGGTWVHWGQPNVWTEIQRYGMADQIKITEGLGALEEFTMNFKSSGRDGSVPVRIANAEMDRTMAPLVKAYYDVDGQGGKTVFPNPYVPLQNIEAVNRYDKLSVQDRMDQLEGFAAREKTLLQAHLGAFSSNTPDKAGFLSTLRYYALAGYDWDRLFDMSGMYKLENGQSSLAGAMLSEFHGKAIFGVPVVSIITNPGDAEVVTRAGKIFKAKHIVCTIPLHCLPQINFDPPLPSFVTQAKHANFGGKVHFHVDKKVPGWFGCSALPTSTDVAVSDTHSSSGGTHMIAFPVSAGFIDKHAIADKPQEFADTLIADLVPPAWNTRITKLVWHDWNRDEYSRGQWGSYGPSMLSGDLGRIMNSRQISDRVALASADWASGWVGFIDGAIEEGKHAAREILSKTRRAML